MIADPRLISSLTRVIESTIQLLASDTPLVGFNADRVALYISCLNATIAVSTKVMTNADQGITIPGNPGPPLVLTMANSAGLCCMAWHGFSQLGLQNVHVVEVLYEPWRAAGYTREMESGSI